jgi:ketosteroid isomerase-like protein
MTASDARKLEIVHALYAATGAGDFDTAETYLTDDFFITEAEDLPMRGVYRGRRALRDLYTKVFAMLKVSNLDVKAHCAGGDYVVTILELDFAEKSAARAEICEVFRFRGEKVCEIKPYYFDAAPVIAAAKAKR